MCRERGRSGGSSGGLGGGGGAGETELQLQRRRLRSRIKVLKRQLEDVSRPFAPVLTGGLWSSCMTDLSNCFSLGPQVRRIGLAKAWACVKNKSMV